MAGQILVERRVLGVVAVVPHHPELALGTVTSKSSVAAFFWPGWDDSTYGSSSGTAVDVNWPDGVAAGDVVARQPDDPLDEVVVAVGGGEADERQRLVDGLRDGVLLARRLRREPAARIAEHDDIAVADRDSEGSSSFTMMRSSICSVFSIDADGM